MNKRRKCSPAVVTSPVILILIPPPLPSHARSISSLGTPYSVVSEYLFCRGTQPVFIRDLKILILASLIGLSRLHGPLNKIKGTLAASALFMHHDYFDHIPCLES
jgi:hypothetical protein